MNSKQIRDTVDQQKKLWQELKRRWRELELPGSEYSPGDFIACLLLAEMNGSSIESLVARIHQANEKLTQLRREIGLGTALIGTDTSAVLSLTLVEILSPTPVEVHPTPELPPTITLTACPHCNHNFAACELGAYHMPVVEPHYCIHVDDEGNCTACTRKKIVECYGCQTDLILSKGHHCKNGDHETVYCDKCKDKSLSTYGYCEDCSTIGCDGCNCEVEAGEEKHCSNQNCQKKSDFCTRCAQDLLGTDGQCATCAGVKEEECSECLDGFIASRLTHCKDEECQNAYCDRCKDKINTRGYCEDCGTLDCDGFGCEEEIERDTEHRCKKDGCTVGEDFCEKCAGQLLNENGWCAECADEMISDCCDCGESFIGSRLTDCVGEACNQAFCPQCKEKNLNRHGFCENCRD